MLSSTFIPSSFRAHRILALSLVTPLAAQVTMTGPKVVAPNLHDGGLRPAVGVQEHALFRPTHSTSREAGPLEGHGVIHQLFHHHPFITYWNNRFWVYHIGFDVDESTKTGYLHWSDDGRTWNDTDRTVLFPAPLATHQRVAFHAATNGRLLATTWHSQNGEAGRGGVEAGSSAKSAGRATSVRRWCSVTTTKVRLRASVSLLTKPLKIRVSKPLVPSC